jgi:hypothetical protein
VIEEKGKVRKCERVKKEKRKEMETEKDMKRGHGRPHAKCTKI